MHAVRTDILSLFKITDKDMLSTTDIISRVFAEDFRKIENDIADTVLSQESKEKARHLKAKLHRRALHHINKLISEGILVVKRVGAKGEKFFAPSMAGKAMDGTTDGLFFPQQHMPSAPIEGYENKDIIYKFEADTWIPRLNAVLIEATKFDTLKSLKDAIIVIFGIINDVVIMNDFEYLLEHFPIEEVVEFFMQIEAESRDYDKRVCLVVDFTNLMHDDRLLQFFATIVPLRFKSFTIIFDVTSREMMDHAHTFEKIVMLFSRYRLKLNIKNDELHNAPFGVGRAGPYTFAEKDWRGYVQNIYPGPGKCLACTQASVVIDVKRFFDEFQKAHLFSDMVQKISKSMFVANSMQRRHANEYFKTLYDNDMHHNLFALSRMFIRFWNYEFEHPYIDKEGILEVLKSTEKQVNDFCNNEETIYLSCGMPRRFSIGFSSAYKRFDKKKVLFEASEKIGVHSMNDIYSKTLRNKLAFKEKISERLTGGDEVRFQRVGTSDPIDIVREFQALLHTYRFPFFCYNFSQTAGSTITLTSFLEGENND